MLAAQDAPGAHAPVSGGDAAQLLLPDEVVLVLVVDVEVVLVVDVDVLVVDVLVVDVLVVVLVDDVPLSPPAPPPPPVTEEPHATSAKIEVDPTKVIRKKAVSMAPR